LPDITFYLSTLCLLDTSGKTWILGFKTPDTFIAEKKYPLVVYLHGGTGVTINNKGEKAYEMLSPLIDSIPLLLASPSADRTTRWWSSNGLYRILQTVRYMKLRYPVDESRIFLAGVSDGAAGCWAAINCINGPFAGFIAISGYGGIVPSTGIDLNPSNISQRPIHNINGGKDHLYPLDIVTGFLDYMQTQGVTIQRSFYPDEAHGFDYREKEFGTLCTILRSWSRPSAQNGSWIFTSGVPNRPDNCIDYQFDGVSPVRSYKWKLDRDSLIIDATGLKAITLELPTTSDFLFVITNGNRKGKIKPEKTNIQILNSMVHYAISPVTDKRIYTVTF
jgi:dienelactone hydrolase